MIRVKTSLFGKGNRYKVRYIAPDGTEDSKTFPNGKKRQAEAFRTQVDSSLLDGSYVDPRSGRRLFKELAADWVKGTSPDRSSRETVQSQLNNQILPFFDKHTVQSAASIEQVHKWLDWMESRGLDPVYQAQLFKQFSSIMELAKSRRWIRENPCKSKEVIAPKGGQRKIIPWTETRTRAIWSALPDRNKIVVPLGRGIGLRQGEILGFSPDDIRRADGLVDIQRQIRRVEGVPVFSLPKGNKTRVAPLAAEVLQEIDLYMELFEPVPVTLPWRHPDGRPETVQLLMTREDGKTWYGELFNATVWAGAFRGAKLTRRRRVDGLHALRHLFASDLLGNGVSINELAEFLGHSDAAITLRYYAHLIASSHDRARTAIGAAFQPATAQRRPDHAVDLDEDGAGNPSDMVLVE
ncbi:tyrosine-type recombinase/integrase [Nocardia sp. CA-135953]|uniref:tyrosine-type recombinase/integrase n=1 Tax=Nocardia sp. CA-135953 TaxID=3239978 RepID=UPI003D96E76C